MGRITKRKQALIEDTKNEMRKKISYTKAANRIALLEKELMQSCNGITSQKVSALKAVLDSNWKKIDKYLPNAAIAKCDQDGNVQIFVNRGQAVIQKENEVLTIEHESPFLEIKQ